MLGLKLDKFDSCGRWSCTTKLCWGCSDTLCDSETRQSRFGVVSPKNRRSHLALEPPVIECLRESRCWTLTVDRTRARGCRQRPFSAPPAFKRRATRMRFAPNRRSRLQGARWQILYLQPHSRLTVRSCHLLLTCKGHWTALFSLVVRGLRLERWSISFYTLGKGPVLYWGQMLLQNGRKDQRLAQNILMNHSDLYLSRFEDDAVYQNRPGQVSHEDSTRNLLTKVPTPEV